MDLERKADNHPDAEPPRGSERRASLKPERGSVEKVPRNRKRQSRSALSPVTGDRRFESVSLRHGVCLASAFHG